MLTFLAKYASGCRLLAGSIALAALLGALSQGHAMAAFGQASATLQANPNILMADGRSKATITVTIEDGNGHILPDGTQVHFTTNSGTVDPDVALSSGGVARTTLISSPINGIATVTASFISPNGAASGVVTVEFTTDSELANTDQAVADWIRVTGSNYLAYSADTRIIDAAGSKQGVHIAYRGITIDANAAQVDLDANQVHAQHATIKHGRRTPLQVDSLVYYLDSHAGTAMIANAPGQHTVQQVSIDGDTLTTKPLHLDPNGQRTDYQFQDLSQGHVLITAASILVQPHQKIAMSRATIYIDSKRIVSMPNQVMPLTTDQVFGQQVLGYGTDGLYLDVPYYASLSPTSTGMFSLRSQAASVQAGTFYQGRSILALDYDRAYSDATGNRQGDFKIIGMSGANWGMRWTQSMRLAGGTQTYLYVDSPMHRSMFGSVNMRHDFGALSLSMDGSLNRPLFGNVGSDTRMLTLNLQTPNHRLIGRQAFGINYSEQASYALNSQRFVVGSRTYSSRSSTRSVGMRFDTPPLKPDRRTTLTDSFTVEQSYSDTNHFSALNLVGNVQMTSLISPQLSTTFSYNYTHYPVFGAVTPIISGNSLLGLYNATDKQNFTWMVSASAPANTWGLTLSSTYGLPTKDLTFGGGLTYRLSSQMHLGLNSYYSQFSGYTFRDYDFSIAHRLGARDVVISWSALQHRWQINLAQAQF